jgi:hypothetical protein
MTTTALPAPTAPPPRPGGPNAWLVIGAVFTVVVLVLGGLTVAGWLGYRTENQTASYSTLGVPTIVIETGTGNVTLTAGAADTVTVSRRLFWSYNKPTSEERWEGQTLHVTSDCDHLWIGPGCGIDYTLGVPEGTEVRAQTGTGDISVRNIHGRLQLTTGTGDISVAGATQSLTLDTGTGDINAVELSCDTVHASTGTGDLTLRFTASPDSVVVSTGTGDAHIFVPDEEAYRVVTDSGTGDIDVGVRRNDASGHAIEARTGTGDIDIQYG